MLFAFVAAGSVTAQCDWTYYADSLVRRVSGVVVDGRARVTSGLSYELSMEGIDSSGAKVFYAHFKSGLAKAVTVTQAGEVFFGNSPHPYYRL